MSENSPTYTARHLSVLEGLDAVRKRPGMYIGSTDNRGLMHCLWEIIDNSVDEALAGFAKRIFVTLHKDGSAEVSDDGRGIPVDVDKKTGLTGVELVFTKLHAGGKFGGGSYAASGGLHGVGASVVNALSSRLDVSVRRNSKTFSMSFRRGEPGVFEDNSSDLSVDSFFEPFGSVSELLVRDDVEPNFDGTTVRYWVDKQIFGDEIIYDVESLFKRARQTAFLVPGLEIFVRDERKISDSSRDEEYIEEVFCYEGGVSEFVDSLVTESPVTDIWDFFGKGSFVENVPTLDDLGQLVHADVSRICEVSVSMRWSVGYDTDVRSFVNIVETSKGGTHVSGFEQAVVKVFKKFISNNSRKFKLGSGKIEKEDIFAGMVAVIAVKIAEPQFEGQTKEVLGTSAIRGIVANVVEVGLLQKLNSKDKGEAFQVSALLDKCVSEMKSRISARSYKETQRRKNALESSSLPAKLVDCRTKDVELSELFIVEGDSALGTAKLARSSDYQALLPIRGKILNVQKASVKDMLENSECASIIQVVGGGSGASFQIDSVRYGKIVIMTDADVDGAHIRTLLLTLFFRYMRPLVDSGLVYAAVPPLHRVEVLGRKKKEHKFIYTYSEVQLAETLLNLQKNRLSYKEPIQRYKGLGEMDADQLADTTMDVNLRSLRRVRISDALEADKMFDLLMGASVAPRKNFIISGAENLDKSKIDI